jgi:hypothetical protein
MDGASAFILLEVLCGRHVVSEGDGETRSGGFHRMVHSVSGGRVPFSHAPREFRSGQPWFDDDVARDLVV